MLIGILSDTHDDLERTHFAVRMLRDAGAQALFHCGDLAGPRIVEECAILPFYFVFGNHDSDMTHYLQNAARMVGAHCLGWGGEVTLAGKRIAVVHGHITADLRPRLEAKPDYCFSGHSHEARDWYDGPTRRINPGALFRAEQYTVALLDLASDELRFLMVPK